MPAHKGSKNSSAKLTAVNVKSIWRRIQKGEPYTHIAKDYPQVAPNAISKIGRGETWNSITGLEKGKIQYRHYPVDPKRRV